MASTTTLTVLYWVPLAMLGFSGLVFAVYGRLVIFLLVLRIIVDGFDGDYAFKAPLQPPDISNLVAFACVFISQLPIIHTMLGFLCLAFGRTVQKTTPERSMTSLRIVLVSKGTNDTAVWRSIAAALHAIGEFQISLVLLIDEPYHIRFQGIPVHVVSVPASFKAQNARYKARALEYFRKVANLGSDDWVLHLDEESAIDRSTILGCLNFIKNETTCQMGQGLILYNKRNFWKNWFLAVADIPRIVDDLGKLRFQSSVVHRPYWGVRGSFLLVQGQVENIVGWDTDCLVEDYDFAWKAIREGFRCGWIEGICREESPQTLSDFIQQRRRWYSGTWSSGWAIGRLQMLSLIFSTFAPYAYFLWEFLGPCGHRTYPLVVAELRMFLSIDIATKSMASLMQDLDAGTTFPSLLLHQIAGIILGHPMDVLERTCCLLGIFYPPESFHVINKEWCVTFPSSHLYTRFYHPNADFRRWESINNELKRNSRLLISSGSNSAWGHARKSSPIRC